MSRELICTSMPWYLVTTLIMIGIPELSQYQKVTARIRIVYYKTKRLSVCLLVNRM